jgi:hypothetical protein
LFSVCETLRGDFLMTYDNADGCRLWPNGMVSRRSLWR